jgi:aminoglycoside phosphotransferase (APT) family kinase protein
MDALEIVNRGTRRRLVIRRYTESEWIRREPDLAAREAAVLRALDKTPGLRTPKLVAVDPDGRDVGSPTVLMTRLDGHTEWSPPSIERIAAIAPALHAVTPPPGFRRYKPYYDFAALKPPDWCTQPRLWERALEVAAGARVDWPTTCFIHRDHHAGNVLWSRGRVSGVVDWVEASIGPPAVDSARMRMNLAAQMGIAASRKYAKCPDVVIDPVWDIVDACDCGSGPLPGAHGVIGLEAFVADALSELG